MSATTRPQARAREPVLQHTLIGINVMRVLAMPEEGEKLKSQRTGRRVKARYPRAVEHS